MLPTEARLCLRELNHVGGSGVSYTVIMHSTHITHSAVVTAATNHCCYCRCYCDYYYYYCCYYCYCCCCYCSFLLFAPCAAPPPAFENGGVCFFPKLVPDCPLFVTRVL